jgi:hypothetical protein
VSSSIGAVTPSGTATKAVTGNTASFALGTTTRTGPATVAATGFPLTIALGSTIETTAPVPASVFVTGSVAVSSIGASIINLPTWLFRRSITIDHTKIPNTDQYNFPMVFAGTFDSLRLVETGGRVTDQNGYDIGFFSDATLSSSLAYERGFYTGSNGQCAYYVLLPTASSTIDGTIYLAYGNPSITSDLSVSSSVWDSNYVGVYHLNAGTLQFDNDSTSYINNLNLVAITSSLGVLDGEVTFDGTSSVLYQNGTSVDRAPMTLEVVFRTRDQILSDQVLVSVATTDSNAPGFELMLPVRQLAVRGTLGVDDLTPSTPSGSVVTGSWNYAGVSYSGSSQRSLTLNNLVVTGSSINRTATFPQQNVSIGARYNGDGFRKQFDGVISEVRVSKIDRSADWRQATYNSLVNTISFYTLGPEVGLLATSPALSGSVATGSIGTATVNIAVVNISGSGVTGSARVGTVSASAINPNVAATTTGVRITVTVGTSGVIATSLESGTDTISYPVTSYRKARKRIVRIRPLP